MGGRRLRHPQHRLAAGPAGPRRATTSEAQLEILETLDVFPSTLPTRRDSVYSGWVSISVGCNNTCTFCIVPALRGKEKDRRPGDILAEIQALVDDGAIEVTLLGQNVNSYGVEFGDRQAFGKLLRACGEIEGLERVRFTSPHPAAFTDDVIDAMAETPNVMPQLHMPLQSGSDRVLKAMRRSYRSARFLGILDKVREQIPDAAITTDIIVGFPGETEEDFEETLDVVREVPLRQRLHLPVLHPARHAGRRRCPTRCPRPSCRSATSGCSPCRRRCPGPRTAGSGPHASRCWSPRARAARTPPPHRLSGRARDNRLVHFAVPDGGAVPRPGDVVEVAVTYGAPHHLVADSGLAGGVYAVRRTRGGDAWAALQDAPQPGRPAVTPRHAVGRAPGARALDAARLRLTADARAGRRRLRAGAAGVRARAHGPGGPRAGRPAYGGRHGAHRAASTHAASDRRGRRRRSGARAVAGAASSSSPARGGAHASTRLPVRSGFGEFGLEVDLPALPGGPTRAHRVPADAPAGRALPRQPGHRPRRRPWTGSGPGPAG